MHPTNTPAVLVTGATGRIGRLIVGRLLDAGLPVRALVRRPDAAATLPAQAEVFTGDLTEPESLDPALTGADAVFLVWTAPPDSAAAVVARLAARVRRVVLLSSPHRTPHPFFQQPNPMADLHAHIERLIAAAGPEATVLRPGMLASNALAWWAPAIRAGQAVRWPYGTAETAPVDDRDVADVAARTLYDPDLAGGDHVLTGPESMTQAAQVRAVGEALGLPVPFEEMTPEEFRRVSEGSVPGAVVDMLLGAWNAAVGRPAHVTTAVADLLGEARTFRRWAADHAAAFRPSAS